MDSRLFTGEFLLAKIEDVGEDKLVVVINLTDDLLFTDLEEVPDNGARPYSYLVWHELDSEIISQPLTEYSLIHTKHNSRVGDTLRDC
jgi:hypothetical protein